MRVKNLHRPIPSLEKDVCAWLGPRGVRKRASETLWNMELVAHVASSFQIVKAYPDPLRWLAVPSFTWLTWELESVR